MHVISISDASSFQDLCRTELHRNYKGTVTSVAKSCAELTDCMKVGVEVCSVSRTCYTCNNPDKANCAKRESNVV